ncbi:hypothetical protein QCN32_gp66 [Arthrobacter phage Niktson]|uniref:Uncharacterized protein n=1 Tax=Arthrobacter phage Niktson TaxID=2014347 RepID=A0A218M5N4_9CAUD|nr:hypothetical protein QCN32_gp66 [Arthrobacter phage Niktson]ASD52288.1 hypothetical protein NIKTSON_66 [Arthrobacter phage Niktson]ASD52382.1 hypothetical protein ELEPHANTMAN_66 [Arthrobacter phage ElephantMan]
MPTFQRTETVDARQFTGGRQQGTDLAFWVNSNGGKAYWRDEQDVLGKKLSERIALETRSGNGFTFNEYAVVWVGDWIIHHQNGTWEAVRPEQLREEYNEV